MKKIEASIHRGIVEDCKLLNNKITLRPLHAHVYLQSSTERWGWAVSLIVYILQKTEKKNSFLSEPAWKL